MKLIFLIFIRLLILFNCKSNLQQSEDIVKMRQNRKNNGKNKKLMAD